MLNARGGCLCIVMRLGSGEDKINNPVNRSFRVKSFIDCPVVFVDFQGGRQLWLSGLVSSGRKRKWQVKCRSGGVWRLCLSSRLSSGPPDDPSSCSFEGSSQSVWVNIFFFS